MSHDAPAPLYFTWEGDVMVPLQPKRADQEYTIGQQYRLGEIPERSVNSHKHFFAEVDEAWRNIREGDERFSGRDHLRAYALIKAGYCTTFDVVVADEQDRAKQYAALLKLHRYALIDPRGNVIRVSVADSMAVEAMDAAEFQQCKNDVLDVLARIIGVTRREFEKNIGRAA